MTNFKMTIKTIKIENKIADRTVNGLHGYIYSVLFPNLIKKFMFYLRIVEFFYNKQTKFSKLLYYMFFFRFVRLSTKLGFYIPINVFDRGLYIPHSGCIVVNPNTKCGKYCLLHNDVVIGHNNGKAPSIGNGVFIGPGAKIFGDVIIADNIWIGANSVVTKSFMEPNLVIAGAPARIIGFRDEPWYKCENKG